MSLTCSHDKMTIVVRPNLGGGRPFTGLIHVQGQDPTDTSCIQEITEDTQDMEYEARYEDCGGVFNLTTVNDDNHKPLKPIFHQNANPLALGPHISLDPKCKHFVVLY